MANRENKFGKTMKLYAGCERKVEEVVPESVCEQAPVIKSIPTVLSIPVKRPGADKKVESVCNDRASAPTAMTASPCQVKKEIGTFQLVALS